MTVFRERRAVEVEAARAPLTARWNRRLGGRWIFPLLIGLIYYGVFTPMGLVMRMTGRDVLGKKLDPSLPSYWHERGAPRPASSYFKLY